jgi:phospho-N-acetylmuramoyl-pentapeptide-transferase
MDFGSYYISCNVSCYIKLTDNNSIWKEIDRIPSEKAIGRKRSGFRIGRRAAKKGTPTMGGIIIILGILIPTLLFANLEKVYIRLMLLCTVWLGAIGFIDDYLKIRSKRLAQAKGEAYKKSNSDGLAGRFKIFGQVMLGIIVGATLYFNQSVVVKREVANEQNLGKIQMGPKERATKFDTVVLDGKIHEYVSVKTMITTIPFVKNHSLIMPNYCHLPGAIIHIYCIYLL